jgi:tetratricopeptide (TPR) repeat protein
MAMAKNEVRQAADGLLGEGGAATGAGLATSQSASRGGPAQGSIERERAPLRDPSPKEEAPPTQKPRESFEQVEARLVGADDAAAPDAKKGARKDQVARADLADMADSVGKAGKADKPDSNADRGPARVQSKKAEMPAEKEAMDKDLARDSKLDALAGDAAKVAPAMPPRPATAAKPAAHQSVAAVDAPQAPAAMAPTPSPTPTAAPMTEAVQPALAVSAAEARHARSEADQTEQVIALYREASYARAEKNYLKAAQLFHRAYEVAPTGPRAPDALLQEGIAEQASNQQAEADATFARLVREFPSSREANEANSRLDSLRQRAKERMAPSPKAAAPSKTMNLEDFSR